ncbi:AAA family ATPase [Tessaracoccus terricola]
MSQRVVFMCGPAGSGKTTHAHRLEADGMARLSFDATAWELGHRSMPLPDDVHRQVEQHLRAELARLLSAGRDVVLDFSFWSRSMRDDWRRNVRAHGVEPETIYLATDRETVLARIGARAGEHRDDFELDAATAAAYLDNFQPPSPDEGPLTVIS